MDSLTVETILETYDANEIATEITRLKKELKNLYNSTSAAGKSGARSLEAVRNDINAFAAAKKILAGGGGVVTTVATWGGN